jgi:thiol-disulfide isomerase/thioredoxin
MYRLFFLFSFILLTVAGCKNNNIEINGKLADPVKNKYIYLDELKSNELIPVDSLIVADDGTFTFSREVTFPSFYLLRTDESNFLTMLLEPGQKIELKACFDSLNYPSYLSGSGGTELMTEYNRQLRKTIKKLSGLREIYLQSLGRPELPSVMDHLDSLRRTYVSEINAYTKKYIDENLNSLVSLVALYQQVAPREYVLQQQKDIDYFIKVDSSLSKLYPDYEPVKALHEEVRQLLSNSEELSARSLDSDRGAKAPEIALPSPQGDTIRLSSTRGKYVLLDFWASWCSPCRLENPNLVKAYNLYHNNGFEIYQVSLDKSREAWLKGIQDDHLDKWIQVSDVKYWNSVVVPIYKINSIPANFLLDKEGRVIASNLRGERLQTTLSELFKDK